GWSAARVTPEDPGERSCRRCERAQLVSSEAFGGPFARALERQRDEGGDVRGTSAPRRRLRCSRAPSFSAARGAGAALPLGCARRGYARELFPLVLVQERRRAQRKRKARASSL